MRQLLVAFTVLACASCSAPETTDPATARNELVAERVAMLERAKSTGFDVPKLDCPARKVSDETAEAMLMLWVNKRTDLVDDTKLRTFSDDMITAFEACGADMDSVINEMRTSDDLLMKGLSIAILKAGRGLS
ncbi:hypothetical protein LJR164_004427 [Phenylobacterium sp. LjRoot164]|uniref:hypothetical protein n=1 Tax=unclassified Phenylobacterium TaxID=2640670 RepID=UPI003ED0B0F1